MPKADKRTIQLLPVQKNYYQSKAITHIMHWISRNINFTLTDLINSNANLDPAAHRDIKS